MADLVCDKMRDKKCNSCETIDKPMVLSLVDIQAKIKESFPFWKSIKSVDDESKIQLSRFFRAKSFQCALDAINKMGQIAEREGHHPDFHLTNYRDVEIVLYTHSVGGVTQNDLNLAEMFDEVDIVYSPKWLRESLII
mmetsp:Transcript_20194/g.19441  ORF Transcript_20194/g.19441 Transcript_20194/m.19441 type:complete len:138 (-) Transcript_20194:410-823(-)